MTNKPDSTVGNPWHLRALFNTGRNEEEGSSKRVLEVLAVGLLAKRLTV